MHLFLKSHLQEQLTVPLRGNAQPLQIQPEDGHAHPLIQDTALVEARPAQGKKMFIMRRFEGKTYQEIADALQFSARTVAVHFQRSPGVLRNGLASGRVAFSLWPCSSTDQKFGSGKIETHVVRLYRR